MKYRNYGTATAMSKTSPDQGTETSVCRNWFCGTLIGHYYIVNKETHLNE